MSEKTEQQQQSSTKASASNGGGRKFGGTCACNTCGERKAKQLELEQFNPQAAYWRHRMQLPGVNWTLSGHSRALERTGFFLEEPKIFLDAGVPWKGTDNGNSNAVLVTHTHVDHINALQFLVRVGGNADPAMVVPREHVQGAREYARMSFAIKGEDGSERAGQRTDVELKPIPKPGVVVNATDFGTREPTPASSRGGRLWVPASPGVHLRLPGPMKVVCACIRCFHTLVDAGYVLCETKQITQGVDDAAQKEYEELLVRCRTDRSAGRDIGKMNKSGRLRKVESYHPKLAYLCDTTTQVFGKLCKSCGADGDPASCYFASKWGSPCEKDFSLRMQQRALLMECSTIVVECSFLGINGMTEAEADAEAIKRGHASWGQLREHVEESPQILFVLVHFSLRYTDSQIREYFQTAGSDGQRPPNVVLWLDSGIDDPRPPPAPKKKGQTKGNKKARKKAEKLALNAEASSSQSVSSKSVAAPSAATTDQPLASAVI